MQLTQQETNKVKERDEQHTQELREWRSELSKKKQVLLKILWQVYFTNLIRTQVLEDDFKRQRDDKEKFYSAERPLPKQLRVSMSLPNASWEDMQPSMRTRSASDQHLSEVQESSDPLDDVVLGNPLPNETNDNSTPNGNSS